MESGIIMELYNYGIIELYWAQVGPLLQQHEEHDTPDYNRSDFKQGFILMNPLESDNKMLGGWKHRPINQEQWAPKYLLSKSNAAGTLCSFQYRSHKPRNFCKIKNLNQKKGLIY